MLFENDENTGLPKELFEQLKQRAKDMARVLKELKEENRELKEIQARHQEDVDTLKARISFYESERKEMRADVEDLIKEFEQVSR